MRLTQRCDYALRMLMYLALTGERVATAPEIASRYGLSSNHLMKVGRALVDAGYLRATRGRGGGFELVRAPEAIRVGEVVRAMEPDLDLVECMRADGACAIHGPCRLEGLLRDATDAFLRTLDDATLADLVGAPAPLRVALGLPRTGTEG